VAGIEDLRDEFPVLAAKAYLNAGTQGPVPRRSVDAAARELEAELSGGRGTATHFEAIFALVERLRSSVAPLLGCQPNEVALTRSTTDGINVVLGALELGPGDEVLTSDEEHPGLLAPLAAARARRNFAVRAVPFTRLAEEVREDTSLVACSHVSWVSGAIVATIAPETQETCEQATRLVSSRTSSARRVKGTARTAKLRRARAAASGASSPGCSSSEVRTSSPGPSSSAPRTTLIPSVVERVSATSFGWQPSSGATEERRRSTSAKIASKWVAVPRPPLSSASSSRAAASTERRGTGPCVPAFR